MVSGESIATLYISKHSKKQIFCNIKLQYFNSDPTHICLFWLHKTLHVIVLEENVACDHTVTCLPARNISALITVWPKPYAKSNTVSHVRKLRFHFYKCWCRAEIKGSNKKKRGFLLVRHTAALKRPHSRFLVDLDWYLISFPVYWNIYIFLWLYIIQLTLWHSSLQYFSMGAMQ